MTDSLIQRRVLRLCGVALAALLLLTGCAPAAVEQPSTPAAVPVDGALPASPIIERFVSCLQDKGWDAYRDSQGMPAVDNVPEGQNDVEAADADECGQSSGWSTMGQRSGLTDAQLGALYEQEVKESECVAALGYETKKPPSLQTYIDTFESENQYYGWRPGLEGLPQAKFNEAVRACPPPTWYMNLPGI